MSHNRSLGLLAAALVLVPAAPALAAPVTVDLRVEGPTRTLVEQKVTVDVRPFKFSDSPQTYPCDGTGSTGTTTVPSPTRMGALAEAAERTQFELTGTFSSFGPSFNRINGENVAYDNTTKSFLAEYKNGTFAMVGGCGDPIASGDDVLFAYGTGNETLLRLAGPATVRPGESATFAVTDQAKAVPVANATVAGLSTGADGRVTTVAFSDRGPQTFKATKPQAIRSNQITVCVTDGADGFCGTTKPPENTTPTVPTQPSPAPTVSAPTAPAPTLLTQSIPAASLPPLSADTAAAPARIAQLTHGQRFAAGKGPRELKGLVDEERSGIKDVRVRLSRTHRGRCTRYDGTRERLVRAARCGVVNARSFSVGTSAAFSYLLPAALPAGRYVLDVLVTDQTGNRTRAYLPGRNRVVFFVA